MLLLPGKHWGQTPNLGTAFSYAIFTAAGAVSNVGTTVITGDLGTNAGAVSGFPPGVINGAMHVADPTSLTVANDVNALYGDLGGRICNFALMSTIIAQTLTPGVHCIGAAATLTGDLVLDGLGNPNAMFIIKIGGAFSTSTFVDITTINSASLKNVYWHIDGAVDIGSNSNFMGNIVAAGAIHFLANASHMGRALSTVGEITMDNNQLSNAQAVLLPISLMDFTVTRQGGIALLKWSTSYEQNSKSFIVERSNSEQATSWKTVGTLAAAGGSTSTRHYSMVDKKMSKGANYYRLRSTDINGTYNTSKVRVLNWDDASSMLIQVYPNPVKNTFTVDGAEQGSTILLVDMAGKTLKKQRASGNGSDQMETSQFKSGTYLLKVVSANGTATIIKLNKQ